MKRKVRDDTLDSRRSIPFAIKVNKEEMAILKKAAGPYPLATWARVQIMKATRKREKDADV